MNDRVLAGLQAMLARREEALVEGAEPVGWKIGFNMPPIQQKLGIDAPVVGFLTSRSVIHGGEVSLAGYGRALLEPEIAIHLGSDLRADAGLDAANAAIAGLGPALELVDMPEPPDDVEQALAGNIFHRGVVFGEPVAGAALDGVTARFAEQDLDARAATGDPAQIALHVASLLEAAGSELRAGDRIIAGSMTVPAAVQPGETHRLDAGPLGAVELRFSG